MKKFFNLFLGVGIFILCMEIFIVPSVYAVVKMYTATSESYASELESQDVAKQRAKEKAIRKAREQAGVYLKSYVRTENLVLTDEEISAVTSNTYTLVGEPTYSREIQQLSDETTVIVWKATVKLNIDNAELKKFAYRDAEEKSKIVTGNNEISKSIDENENKFETLRNQARNAKTETERQKIKSEFENLNKDFLVEQKIADALKLSYRGDYDGAIKIYTGAIQTYPNSAELYCYRAWNYILSLTYLRNSYEHDRVTDLAIRDATKAIQLKPNYSKAYTYLGTAYLFKGGENNAQEALKDFNKAIQLDSKNFEAYALRGRLYDEAWLENEKALADLNKAIEINPKSALAYAQRAMVLEVENPELAIRDYTQAIKLNPYMAYAYGNRAALYLELEDYRKALEDYNKAIELYPNNAEFYEGRGYCYQALGNTQQAKKDFAKAQSLS